MDKPYRVTTHETLRDVLNSTVADNKERTAFLLKIKKDEKKAISFTQLGKEIEALGAALVEAGYRDKIVAVIGPNSYNWFISYMAIACGTGISAPLDKALTAEEIRNSIELGDIDAVIYDKSNEADVKEAASKAGIAEKDLICMDKLAEMIASAKEEYIQQWNAKPIAKEDTCAIIFTSGTTSNAKAVVLSHYNIAANINQLNAHEQFYKEDVFMALLPYHHSFGFTGQLLFTENGCVTVYTDGIRHIQKNFQEYHVSLFFAVPMIIEFMHKRVMDTIKSSGKEKKVELARKVSNFLLKMGIDVRRKLFKEIIDAFGGNLRLLISGAAPLDPKVERDFNDFGIFTVQGYGLTETSPVVAAENPRYLRYGSIGHVLPEIEYKIVDKDPDGVGELVVKGPNVMQGYYKNEEATRAVLQDGWFYTGDFVREDSDHFLYITGRKKNVIVLKNGKNVFPEELETILAKLPYIVDCFVWGYGDPADLSNALKLTYDKDKAIERWPQLAENFSEEALKDLIWGDVKAFNETMVSYKHITYLCITDQPMIKTSTSKVKRPIEIANTDPASITHISSTKK